jgi:vacuolar-type H+-ATPase subunit C/Vma6
LFQLRAAFAYLWLLEAEVRDITMIVEGKFAGLPSREIGRRLVRAA